MYIAIPTLGRVHNQRTWHSLSESLKTKTALFVQAHEAALYQHASWTYNVLPPDIFDIASTRDYIIQHCIDRGISSVIMMDDDLDFATRRADDDTKFSAASSTDIDRMCAMLSIALQNTAHVSVSPREGANRDGRPWLPNTRAMRVLGYSVETIKHHGLKFGPATFMCDFHMTLSLLTLGYRNEVYNAMVNNQQGSNVSGGCSTQRTKKTQQEAAEWLAAQWPDFVTVVKKQTKTSWGGEERYDVRIQWKAAYDYGRSRRVTGLLDRYSGQYSSGQRTGTS